jgi:hypothetical protein
MTKAHVILVSDWLISKKIFSSETARPNESKLCKQHPWKHWGIADDRSFGSFGQAVSEEKISKNWPIRNKNCLWRPCLLMNRDKMSNLYKEPSIDASY